MPSNVNSAAFQKLFLIEKRLYTVNQHLSDLGWDDFDFGYSTLCPILLGHMKCCQNGLSQDGQNILVKVNLTQVRWVVVHPVHALIEKRATP